LRGFFFDVSDALLRSAVPETHVADPILKLLGDGAMATLKGDAFQRVVAVP